MIKRFFVFILLMALSIRPAYFVGMVVYYETHLNEIIEKYCINKDKPELQCNGKCHLAKEITGIDATDDTKAIVNVSAAFYPVYFQQVEQSTFTFIATKKSTKFYKYLYTYSYLLSNKIDKPPMV